MKYFILLISFIFFGQIVLAQCPPSGYNFDTQQKIDDFSTSYPGCTNYPNTLEIYESTSGNITNLDGLSIITTAERLSVFGNDALNNLDGLSNITFIGDFISIRFNDALLNLDGLSSITSVGFHITIVHNIALTNVDGLNSINSIGGGIGIINNDVLSNLDGISNIDPTTIKWLNSTTDDLRIYNNPLLSVCEVQSVCDFITLAASDPDLTTNIHDNAPGCNSEAEVDAACNACTLPTNVTLTSQQQIDDFPTDYPNCTEVVGDLTINDAVNGDILNLDGLAQLISIGGFLKIEGNSALEDITGLSNVTLLGLRLKITSNSSLTSLSGLENISVINRSLTISSNPSLVDLTGLDGLTTISWHTTISNNFTLASFHGLESLSSVGGFNGSSLLISNNNMLVDLTALSSVLSIPFTLDIRNNSSLVSLDGLENISSVETLDIRDNTLLSNLDGLNGLMSISNSLMLIRNFALANIDGLSNLSSLDYLFIADNDFLLNINGLTSLTSIDGRISIFNNDLLQNINGLSNVNQIDDLIYIDNNSSLVDISGIENIDPNSIFSANFDDIEITNNPLLSVCEVQSVCDFITLAAGDPNRTTNIHDNAAGCNSEVEVDAACNACTPPTTTTPSPIGVCYDITASGYVYQMQNADDLIRTDASHTVTYYEDVALTMMIDPTLDYIVDNSTIVYAIVNDGTCDSPPVDVTFQIGTYFLSPFQVPTSCGLDNGSYELGVTGGFPPYQFSLDGNTAQASGAFSNLSAGFHSVEVSDMMCSFVVNFTIIDSDPLDVSNTTTTTTCGQSTGTVSFTLNTGTSPISIDGGTPVAFPTTLTGLPAGNYDWDLEDADGCLFTTSFTITAVDGLDITATPTHTTCDLDNGSVAFTINQGTAPITYTDGGTTITDFTDLAAGFYTWDAEDDNGCDFQVSFTIDPSDPLNLTLPNTNPTTCGLDNGSLNYTVVTGTTPIVFTEDGQVVDVNMLSAGAHSFIATDANGCTLSFTKSVNDSDPLNLFVQTIGTRCAMDNGEVSFTVFHGTLPITFTDGGTTVTAFTGLAAGDYTWDAVDAIGCTGLYNFTIEDSDILEVNPMGSFTDSSAPITTRCNEDNGRVYLIHNSMASGFLSITDVSGPIPYPSFCIALISGEYACRIDDLPAGDYDWTCTDSFGCIDNVSFTVDQSDVLDITATSVGTTCDLDDGEVSFTINTGTAPITYSDNGTTITNFTGLASGAHSWDAVDDNGCLFTVDFTIDGSIAATFTTTPVHTFCDGDNGSVSATMVSGNGPLTYTLNGVLNNTGIYTGLAPGTYTMTAVDPFFCPASSTFVIEGSDPLEITTVVTPTFCNEENGSITATLDSGTAPVDYTIAGQGTNTTGIFTDLAPGTYTIDAIDAVGCEATETFTIDPSISLVITTAVMHTSCEEDNGSVTASLQSGTNPVNYTIAGVGTNNTGMFMNLAPDTYTLTAVDALGCESSHTFDIDDSDLPTFDLAASQPLCGLFNGELHITPLGGTPPYDYNIGQGWRAQSDFTDLSPGFYTVIVADNNGCRTVQTITLDNSFPIGLVYDANEASCDVSSGTVQLYGLDVVAPVTYYLTKDGQSIAGVDGLYTDLEGGVYYAAVIDAIGCTAAVTIAIGNAGNDVEISALSALDCNHTEVTLSGLGSSTGTGITYVWSSMDGHIVSGATTIDVVVDAAGDYVLTVANANTGCTTSEVFTLIEERELPTITITSPDVLDCNTEMTTLDASASSSGATYSYLWTTTDGHITSTADIPSIVVDAAGVYTLLLTHTSTGCESTESITVSEMTDLPIVSIASSGDIDCDTEIVTLDGSASTAGAEYAYSWTTTDGHIISGADATMIDADAAGTYTLLVVNTATGCESSSNMIVNENTTLPTATIASATELDCENIVVTLDGSASSVGTEYSYQWATTDGNIVTGATATQAIIDTPGDYTLLVTNDDTGCATTASVTVTQSDDVPTVSIAAPSSLIDCNTTMITLDGSASETGPTITYAWTTLDGNITSASNEMTVDVSAAGTYALAVIDITNGCVNTQVVTVAADITPPSITTSGAELGCDVSAVEICADVADDVSVTWMTTSGMESGLCISVSSAGSYEAIATASNGCTATAVAVVTLSVDVPQVSVLDPMSISCEVSEVTITAELDGDASDYDITWSTSDGNILSGGSTLTPTVDAAGLYQVSVVSMLNGCSIVVEVNIIENIEMPTASFEFLLVDGTLNLESNSTGSPSIYTWSVGGAMNTLSTTFDETGTYEICLTVSNDCGEDTYCEDVYYVSQLRYESSILLPLCYGDETGSILITPSGGEPSYTVTWVGPGGFVSDQLDITGLVAGDYAMLLRDNFGYEKSEIITILGPTEITETSVAITDESGSNGAGAIDIDLEGGTGAYTYVWNTGETTEDIEGLSMGDYTVIVTDENGCSREFGPYEVSNSVGIDELDLVANVSIYPNPVTEILYIDIDLSRDVDTELKIISSLGKVVSTSSHRAQNLKLEVDVTELPAGIYYLQFGTKTESSVEKFVVFR